MTERIIPTTNLRKLYSFFRFFSTGTQLEILNDYNRKNNYRKIVELYNESKRYFSSYTNDEPFIRDNVKRSKVVPDKAEHFKNTKDVIAFFMKQKEVIVHNDIALSFRYIEREIDPRRMTKATYDDGSSGKSSGIGGIDFIGWNNKSSLPIIGEIKCGSDETPFFAFLQLLMYCAEMATPLQLNRVNGTELFKSKITLPYLLYIFLADFNLHGEKGKFIEPLKNLIRKVVSEISDIENVIILEAHKKSKTVTVL